VVCAQRAGVCCSQHGQIPSQPALQSHVEEQRAGALGSQDTHLGSISDQLLQGFGHWFTVSLQRGGQCVVLRGMRRSTLDTILPVIQHNQPAGQNSNVILATNHWGQVPAQSCRLVG
jgi:hypothetical protein